MESLRRSDCLTPHILFQISRLSKSEVRKKQMVDVVPSLVHDDSFSSLFFVVVDVI
jgi:hypothetical protein